MLERKVLESMAEPDASRHPEYPLKPALATSWTISPTSSPSPHMRRDVLWHDGTPFSGKDVVATVRKILDPSVRACTCATTSSTSPTSPPRRGTISRWWRDSANPTFSLACARHSADLPGALAGDRWRHASQPHPPRAGGDGSIRFEEWKPAIASPSCATKDTGAGGPSRPIVYRFVPIRRWRFQLLKQGQFDLYVQLQPQQWLRDLEVAG